VSSIVVFSPSRYSLYTVCVTELLRRRGIQIQAIVVTRLFNPRRFLAEYGRDGSRLLEKIWKKLVLRERTYRGADYETIASLMQKENIDVRQVDAFQNQYGIPVTDCNDLNDPVVVDTLKHAQPRLVVFTGGGLIRADVLAHAGEGILNCHMGILPRYRGMDVVEWPILEGRPDQVGMTLHFMDAGVDTGDILRVERIPIEPADDIERLRNRFEPAMCRLMTETCVDYLEGRVSRVPQTPEAGRQYFMMHPRLVEIVEDRLRAGSTPANGTT
jgi:folate-dependent phosphoribosylglycinamide formyltransferase PurN